MISKQAAHSGLTLSEYIRRAALRQRISYKLSEEELKQYKELHKYKRNFELISNMYKNRDPHIVDMVKETARTIEIHLKKFTK
ncbi:MAG: plasmid mobilization protein [Draconibacterium sp.]